jgi:hypothetical protein
VSREDETPVEVPGPLDKTVEAKARKRIQRLRRKGTPDQNGKGKTIAKTSAAIAVALVAAYGAVKPEEEARKAVAQVEASHTELRQKVIDLQKWARFVKAHAEKAQVEAKTASAACQAKAEGLGKLVTGVILGELRASHRTRKGGGGSAPPPKVDALVRALGKPRRPVQQTTAQKPSLPTLKAPKRLFRK